MIKHISTIKLIACHLLLAVLLTACKPAAVMPTGNVNTAVPSSNVNTATPVATTTIMSDIDTSTWNTYRNEEYGFEFQHPPELMEKSYYSVQKNWVGMSLCPTESDDGSCIHVSLSEFVRHYSCRDASVVNTAVDCTFKDLAVLASKARCASDGIGGSTYCNEVKTVEKIEVLQSMEVYKIVTTQTTEDFIAKTKVQSDREPVFYIKLSSVDEEYPVLSFFPTRNLASASEKLMLDSIVEIIKTVRL